jgi:carboxymethylenebutenolidase
MASALGGDDSGGDVALMHEHWVDREVTGTIMPMYVSEPAGSPSAGVIILEEIFGVNANIRAIADLVASLGYVAVAPNLFHRTDPNFDAPYDAEGMAKGIAAAGATKLPDLVADLTSAGAYLRERLGDDAKIGTWGFCFGGSVAFLSATLPFVRCAVSFYGGQIAKSPHPSRPPMIAIAAQVRAPILFAFGGKDEHISADDHAVIRKALDARAKPYEFVVFENEDHGFFRSGPDANDGARAVWPLVRDFFAKNLALP